MKTVKVDARQIASMPCVEVRYILVAPRAKGDPAPLMEWKFPKEWDKDCQRHEVYWLEIILPVSFFGYYSNIEEYLIFFTGLDTCSLKCLKNVECCYFSVSSDLFVT